MILLEVGRGVRVGKMVEEEVSDIFAGGGPGGVEAAEPLLLWGPGMEGMVVVADGAEGRTLGEFA